VGYAAFEGCKSLTSITIPESVIEIGANAFSDCKELTSINIPDGVTNIGAFAFSGCSSLCYINIPINVSCIGVAAFIKSGIYTNKLYWYASALCIDNCLIKVDSHLVGDYTIKSNTRLIADYAFADCSALTAITIPESVTCIGDQIFIGCKSLTAILYAGTKEQWAKIQLHNRWNSSCSIQVVRCIDGEISL
jgi:hypothetical protein